MIIKLNEKKPHIILITGDYYIDHPCFGVAIIARLLESLGLSVWIVSQPDPKDNFKELESLPEPEYFFGITSGSIDSTLNTYTVNKVKRTTNDFSPDGDTEKTIKNAVTSYANKIRSTFNNSFILLGGVEASLRKFSHFDFFKNSLSTSLLENCGADIICYGMAENTIKQIVACFKNGEKNKIFNLNGIVHRELSILNKIKKDKIINLKDHDELTKFKKKFYENERKIFTHLQTGADYFLIQKQKKHTIICNPPSKPLSEKEMDIIYSLPYEYRPIPYTNKKIKAFETIKNTIVTHRGCAGGCSFCSITIHQGKKISKRSVKNILSEIKKRKIRTISDLQAPTANMYGFKCTNKSYCKKTSCVYPEICPNLKINEELYLSLLNEIKNLNLNTSIASGIRYDFLSESLLKFIISNNFIGGQLKVAPEHSDPSILKRMNKPDFENFREFIEKFKNISNKLKKDIYIVPYIISSFPGADKDNTLKLKRDLINSLGYVPFQIQDFTPTPGTMATAIYYSETVPVIKDKFTRNKLRELLQGNSQKHKINKYSTDKRNRKNRSTYRKSSIKKI